ncbi:MAG: response regulator [Bacteroidales bacterium]|nr:response regulator [Bacteroidales bacterium]
MKRLTILTVALFLIILLINAIYYHSMYQKQVDYVKNLLGQQIAIIGAEVNNTNITFESDLNEIIMKEDFLHFFDEDGEDVRERITEKLKFYYSKYDNFVETIEYNNRHARVFMLYKDSEDDEWIANTYLAQNQKELLSRDELVPRRNKWDLAQPVYSEGEVIGNIIITVDYIGYFNNIFSKYKLEEQQWQWLIDNEGQVVFSNYFANDIMRWDDYGELNIRSLPQIYKNIDEGINGNIVHAVEVDGESREVISSYYAVELLRREFGMVFSAPADFYQVYIIRNSLLIVSLTILLVAVLILFHRRFISRQAAEAKRMRQSEKTFMRLIDLMPVGVVIVNVDKEVIRANENACQMFSYKDSEEMEGKIMPETLHSGEGIFFAENLGSGFEPNQFMLVDNDGIDTVLYRKEIPVDYLGEEASMIVLMDVTLLEVARKQEARANEAKSEFLAKISHEIRTPLNGIIGMVDMLARMDNEPEIQKIVNLVKNSSDLLLAIINDLLDFSKLEKGSLMLDEIPFVVEKEIEYCFSVISAVAGERVKLSWNINEDVSESVIGDPFRLRQLITNLLTVSLEHTDKGEIRLDISAESAGKGVLFLKFDLRDTGKNYDKALLKKMFGEYVKAENRSISKYEGKGLGGLISRQLIEMMGGTLHATTPSGLSDDPDLPGARFTFSIKVYSNIRIEKDYGASGVKKYSEIKALVISGSRQRDEELLKSLHDFGLATYVTGWQKQTINLIRSNLEQVKERYKVIIIVDAEDFDGFEVAQTIWEENLYKSFMILMLSSNDKKGNYSRCIRYGIDDYLVKPYHKSELLDIIHNRFTGLETVVEPDMVDAVSNDLNILVVEDNVISQKVALTILKSIGYEADLAVNGKEGLEKAGKKKYDIIFMDLVMPEMDGYTAAKKILEISPKTLIIALSADSANESVKKAEIAGIRQFISKPVRQEDMRKILIKYFSN